MNMNREQFLKALNKEGLLIYGTTWLENFKHLQELKKYKEMWEELKYKLKLGTPIELPGSDLSKFGTLDVINFVIKRLEQKYTKKIITIELDKVTEAIMDEINKKIKQHINRRWFNYEGNLGKISIKEDD
ncbi:hypothetical protein KAX08_00400 [candidate division WOR-3 bacterium]|nr:hypothetical protein [candidate division WOR-3 bacterium]